MSFLWPEGSLKPAAFVAQFRSSPAAVEERFARLHPGTHPVLFSSGRAGLSAIVECLGFYRPDQVWLPPYSSHCVLDAVSRTATPTPHLNGQQQATLIYHQWGYVHRGDGLPEIIEDSADSLHLPGTGLFPNNGRFELISLPKILGCAGGGVVFCRKPGDAIRLKEIRNNRPDRGFIQLLLRTLLKKSPRARAYWQGAEALNGNLPGLLCGDIHLRLDELPQILEDRKKKLALVSKLAPRWLKTDPDRLPCNVPVECTEETEMKVRALGITSGLRHFNKNQDIRHMEMVKVMPVPIHQGIPQETVEKIIELLTTQRDRS